MNHILLDTQIHDAQQAFGDLDFIEPPQHISELWANISPQLPCLSEFLQPVKDWLDTVADNGDYVLVQGDLGACYLMVSYAMEKQLIPIYATTQRIAFERRSSDGIIFSEREFKHIKFRKYGI